MTAVVGKPDAPVQKIASAPISFGVFGTIQLDIATDEILGAMSNIGFQGCELGPPGFFGPLESLQETFDSAGLSAVGAYVPLHLVEDEEVFASDIVAFRNNLAELDMCGDADAVAILADEGDADLIAAPFRGPEPRLDAERWALAVHRLKFAADIAEEHGVAVSYHPHFATYVEKASEIDRLMESTTIPLCLDIGHLLVGGADPAEYASKYHDRINHVHIKDVRMSVLEDANHQRRRADDEWWNSLACRLGEGDVDITGVLAELVRCRYSGWFVIEQDRAPVSTPEFAGACADQVHNFDWLTSRIAEVTKTESSRDSLR